MFKNKLDEKARLLASLSNAVRLPLLILIAEQEYCVGELAVRLGISQSALSQHLAKLRANNIVSIRRDAQTVFYRCDDTRVHKVLQTLSQIYVVEGTTHSS